MAYSGMLQHFSQSFDFHAQLSDNSGIWIFIDNGVVDDAFSTIGVSEVQLKM